MRPGVANAVSVAVVGPGSCSAEEDRLAAEVGRRLAEAGATVVTGGLGGVMAAACRGARSAGGVTLGLLPGETRAGANPWVSVPVPTGLGEGRNVLVVRAADALLAVGGEYGTLSEIALALKLGRPVIGLATWELRRPGAVRPDPGVRVARDPEEAVRAALAFASRGVAEGDATA
ncbi:MAG TPA: TIGR00725 family protein [Acidimicrobiales bacterium]|nr:TIGR00725 family protein [Acidimicrobiales bacterium]